MRTEKRPPFYLLLVLFFSTLITGCEDSPDFIGRDLLPSSDDFTVYFDSLELIHGYTRYPDSVRAGFKETHLIGSIADPFFGYSSANMMTTISPTSNSGSFGPNPVVDSVYLIMEWLEVNGEGTQPMTIHIHEFTEFLQFDSTYYTSWDVSAKIKQPPLGSAQIFPDDSLAIVDITDQEFIDKFLLAEDSILGTRNYLQEYIYGLYYTTDLPADEGRIFRFNFDQGENWLRFYYRNDTATDLAQSYSVDNTTNGKVNLYAHETSGFPIESYLNNGSQNDSLMFVQTMAGVNTQLRFPELENWLDSMPVAINEARLFLPIADTVNTMQLSKNFCESLNMFLVNPDGNLAGVYDSYIDPVSYGGRLDSDQNTYVFTIKVQVQSILAGTAENLDFRIVAGNTGESVQRSVLYGWNPANSEKRPRLEITYTKL
jgi:hypothetical protein